MCFSRQFHTWDLIDRRKNRNFEYRKSSAHNVLGNYLIECNRYHFYTFLKYHQTPPFRKNLLIFTLAGIPRISLIHINQSYNKKFWWEGCWNIIKNDFFVFFKPKFTRMMDGKNFEKPRTLDCEIYQIENSKYCH